MKLLLLDVEHFWFDTHCKTIETVEDVKIEERIENSAVVFIHAEAEDEERQNKVIKKVVGNIKWYLNKVNKDQIVLHSFAHLSSSKSSPEFAEEVILSIEEVLKNKGINVYSVPFGYLYQFSIHVKGESLAKVFIDI
ncbi:MAG: threonyl-tRNA synthetase editing domain-containing protein [Methanolobus sp.]|nr:threonyl-tRNA synthetase editing domain-containing protein [Methanolobus sp.]